MLILLFSLSTATANAYEIFIGTGARGSFSHFTGRLIARVVGMHTQEAHCKVIPGAGDMHNLTNIREGSLDIALVGSGMLRDAVTKSGNFAFLDVDYKTLRILAPLYTVPITLVVRGDAGIASLMDVAGKRINIGAPRSPQHLAMETIFTAKKWSPADFPLVAEISTSQSQDTMAFCHGTIQAMVHIGVHPDSALEQLFQRCGAQMIPMADADIKALVAGNPAYTDITIPADTYAMGTPPVVTFGTWAILVGSQDLDDDTVSVIMSALTTHRERLRNAHPALSAFSLKSTLPEALDIPLHPGAAKFPSE